MPEEDAKIFGEAYGIYDRWRGVEISTAEQWTKLTGELHHLAASHDGNRLALRLAISLFETFDDFYANGRKPAIPDYIGRSDL